jgi:hypothetical protein
VAQGIEVTGAATPEWFTGILLGGPALSAGSVDQTTILDRKPAGAMGAVHSVVLEYAPGSAGLLPDRVALKRTRSDLRFTNSEVRFYRELAPELSVDTAPRCFGSFYDEEAQQYALVLEDLSETHECLLRPGVAPVGPEPLGLMMDRLAALHAGWWERPLDGFGSRAADPSRLTARNLPLLGEQFPELSLLLGSALSKDQAVLYRRYFENRAPVLLERLATRRAFALLHGDAHVGNFLLPRVGGAGSAVLVDWGVFRLGPALWDVSYALLWSAQVCQTRTTSAELLKRYHAGLVAGGVSNHSYEECERDFRGALLDNLRAPISQLATPGVPLDVPLRAHGAAMALIDAWACADLLD